MYKSTDKKHAFVPKILSLYRTLKGINSTVVLKRNLWSCSFWLTLIDEPSFHVNTLYRCNEFKDMLKHIHLIKVYLRHHQSKRTPATLLFLLFSSKSFCNIISYDEEIIYECLGICYEQVLYKY